jgi:hypothetical protein
VSKYTPCLLRDNIGGWIRGISETLDYRCLSMGKYQGVEPTARGTCAVIKKNIGNFGRESERRRKREWQCSGAG